MQRFGKQRYGLGKQLAHSGYDLLGSDGTLSLGDVRPVRVGARRKKEPGPGDASSSVALAWLDELYDVIKSESTAPPPASRTYGVTAIALYEAVSPGSLENRSLVGQLNGLLSVPQPKRNDNEDGLASGRCVGRAILQNVQNIQNIQNMQNIRFKAD